MMKEYYYIYEITNKVNGKRYRGKHFTRDLDDGYMGSGIAIKSAYRKYGKENFTKDILMFCKDIDDLNYWESLMVDKYWVDREDTYNMVIGGVGVNGLKLTEETKRKLSETRKARLASGDIIVDMSKLHTDEANKKISEKAKERLKDKTKHPMYGKHHSEEAKKKMSDHHCGGMKKGYKMSDITKLKIKEKAQQRKCKYSKQEMKEKYDHNNGKHWWTDGVSNIFSKVCPSGFYKGRVIQ